MGLDVAIRPPRFPQDWAELGWLLHDHADDLNRTLPEIADLYRDLRANTATETLTAYSVRDGVVGFVALHRGRKLSDRHTASLRLLVATEARGQGVAGRLIVAATDWADENGISRITATPYLRGGLGRHTSLFDGHGFIREGVMRGAVKQGDELLDVAMLARVKPATPIRGDESPVAATKPKRRSCGRAICPPGNDCMICS